MSTAIKCFALTVLVVGGGFGRLGGREGWFWVVLGSVGT